MAVAIQNTEWLDVSHLLQVWQGFPNSSRQERSEVLLGNPVCLCLIQTIRPLLVINCRISFRDRCSTLSVESQLQGKSLRWLGHVFRMPNDRLLEEYLFGEVKGACPPGCPRSSFNDVALRDCQNCQIGRPSRNAQDRLLWRDKTCLACS